MTPTPEQLEEELDTLLAENAALRTQLIAANARAVLYRSAFFDLTGEMVGILKKLSDRIREAAEREMP